MHGTPWHFSETPAHIGIAPELGADNDAVLAEIGYSAAEIQGFRERKIISERTGHVSLPSWSGLSRPSVVATMQNGWPGLRPAMTLAAISRAPSDALRGILLMCAGVSTFPFMNAAVKFLTESYPASEITWARFTGHLLIMLIVFLPQCRWGLLRTRRWVVQLGRSLMMLLSNLFYVMAIGRVSLATGSAIGFTAPLIVTALSVPLLQESVGWRRWSAVAVGFAGALHGDLVPVAASGTRPFCSCWRLPWHMHSIRSAHARSDTPTAPRPVSFLPHCSVRWA